MGIVRPIRTEEQQKALDKWNTARKRYSDESKVFQRIRRSLPPNKRDYAPAQLLTFELARMRYSEAAKAYERAREDFNYAMRPISNQAQLEIRDILAQLDEAIGQLPPSGFKTYKEMKAEAEEHEKYASDPQVQALLASLRAQKTQPEPAPETLLTDKIEDFSS